MSETPSKPVFLVDADSDPVVVKVDGRACFQNSGCLRDFITEMLSRGHRRFVLDLQQCTGMDSTFLGVLAGAAIELRKGAAGGSLVVARAGPRNLELMRNLGLHRLLVIDAGGAGVDAHKCATPLDASKRSEVESARLVLEAHENLVAADATNHAKFQDVLAFLRNRADAK